MNSRHFTRAALAVLLLSFAVAAARVAAQRVNLNYYLVGKWHQDVGEMSGETVFNSNHTFTSLAWTRGTSYHSGARGEWEIRNEDQLWKHNFECSPNPCSAEWDDTRIEVIDQNHFRNRLGDVYRMQ